jgi:inositol-hexakisphosphate kinase
MPFVSLSHPYRPSRSLPASSRPLSDHAPPLSSSPSSSPSSSWSSSAHPEHTSPPHSSSGIGRKMAASLQLFKESANVSPDDVLSCESSRSEAPPSAARRPGQPKDDHVSEPQFEFLKRSEWPDRETAAVRRGRSVTVYQSSQTLDSLSVPEVKSSQKKEKKSSNHDDDNTHGQKEMSTRPSDGRGRRRERTSYENLAIRPDLSMTPIPASTPHVCDRSPFIRPRSRGYPPSPSRSHSPTFRKTPLQGSSDMLSRLMDASHSGQVDTPSAASCSHPQTLALAIPPSARHVFLDTPSSSDDESAWETASAVTSASTVSAKARLSSQIPNTPPHSPVNSDPVSQSSLLMSSSDVECLEDTGDLVKSWSQVRLPPVPLKPFRNQVGGHSSIYKFTKRAVCKVRTIAFLVHAPFSPSGSLAPRITRKSLL